MFPAMLIGGRPAGPIWSPSESTSTSRHGSSKRSTVKPAAWAYPGKRSSSCGSPSGWSEQRNRYRARDKQAGRIPLPRLGELLRLRKLDRHELADPALGHGHAEQTIHARHRDRIVGDGDETGVGALAHGLQEVAEALDIVVVERRGDLVEHADRRRVGEEHREDERKRGQRLFAAGKKRQRLRLLARRLRDKLKPRLKRVVGFDQLQLGVSTFE